jgi:hypothetical protein
MVKCNSKSIFIFLTYAIALFALSMNSFAASVSRELPGRADPNSEITVKLIISGADTTGLLTLEEELPQGIVIKDWNVIGATEPKTGISTRDEGNRYGWSFTPSGSSATVEYKITLGAGNAAFGTLVFFDRSGQGSVAGQTLRVAAITCGDGICEGAETSDTCVADCPKPAEPTTPTTPSTPAEPEPTTAKKSPAGLIIILVVVILLIISLLTLTKKKKA